MKKLLTILLTVLMALTIGTVNVFADDDSEPNIKVSYTSKDGSTKTSDLVSFNLTTSDTDGYTVSYTLDEATLDDKTQIEDKAKELYDAGTKELTCEDPLHVHSAIGGECYSLTCGKENHEHDDSCIGNVCGKEEHKHSSSCYNGGGKLKCSKVEHTHDDSCKGNVCGKVEHTHDDGCYTLTCDNTHTEHRASCYTVIVPIVAEYTAIPVSVTFDLNGGSIGGSTTPVVNTTSIEKNYLVEEPEDPIKANYAFIGYAKTNGGNLIDFETETFESDATVYAQWEKIEVNVTYDVTYTPTKTDNEKLAVIEKNGKWGSRIGFDLVKGDSDQDELDAISAKAKANGETLTTANCSLSLYKFMYRVNKKNGSEKRVTKLKDALYPEMANGYVTIEIELPKDLPEVTKGYKRSFYVYSYHNNEVKEIKPVSIKDDKVVFNASEFSTFAVTYKDTKLPTPSPKPTPKKVTYVAPKTGVE